MNVDSMKAKIFAIMIKRSFNKALKDGEKTVKQIDKTLDLIKKGLDPAAKAAYKDMQDAVNKFYDNLPDDQKKQFDQIGKDISNLETQLLQISSENLDQISKELSEMGYDSTCNL